HDVCSRSGYVYPITVSGTWVSLVIGHGVSNGENAWGCGGVCLLSGSVVTCGGNNDGTFIKCVAHCVGEHWALRKGTERHADNLSAVIGGIDYASSNCIKSTRSV